MRSDSQEHVLTLTANRLSDISEVASTHAFLVILTINFPVNYIKDRQLLTVRQLIKLVHPPISLWFFVGFFVDQGLVFKITVGFVEDLDMLAQFPDRGVGLNSLEAYPFYCRI
jgi:hypothetical protein